MTHDSIIRICDTIETLGWLAFWCVILSGWPALVVNRKDKD